LKSILDWERDFKKNSEKNKSGIKNIVSLNRKNIETIDDFLKKLMIYDEKTSLGISQKEIIKIIDEWKILNSIYCS